MDSCVFIVIEITSICNESTTCEGLGVDQPKHLQSLFKIIVILLLFCYLVDILATFAILVSMGES